MILTEQDKDPCLNSPYISTTEILIYLSTRTRTDVSTAISMIVKFTDLVGKKKWNYLKYLVRYMKETVDHGIQLSDVVTNNVLE